MLHKLRQELYLAKRQSPSLSHQRGDALNLTAGNLYPEQERERGSEVGGKGEG